MTRSPFPDHWQELIAGYTLGDLSPEEAEELKRLMDDHPDLTLEVNHLQEVLALMPYGLPEQEPPAHLRAAILDAAAANREAPRRSSGRHRDRWYGIAGAIAAVLVAALGVDNYRLRQTVQSNQAILEALQQPNTQLVALQGTESANQASGNLVLNPGQQSVVLFVHDLPPLPPGQAYRLWVMPTGSTEPAYCGQFNSTTAGTAATHWALPEAACSSQAAKLLITVESATAPPIPAGPLVMQSTL